MIFYNENEVLVNRLVKLAHTHLKIVVYNKIITSDGICVILISTSKIDFINNYKYTYNLLLSNKRSENLKE